MSFLSAQAKRSIPSPTPSAASSSTPKRKRDEDGPQVVYSQPDETGTGQHIYTQFQYAIKFLKEDQKWYTFDDIIRHLNLLPRDQHLIPQLKLLFQRPHESNRVEYDRARDRYRYRPKYDIRNAAQLKGYLQAQKSSLGLPVKELKDGWPDCADTIDQLERKKEILVSRHKKDDAPKTVWMNDPTLMHPMDDDFKKQWHGIQLPPNTDDLRAKLLAAGLKPSSAPRKIVAAGPREKKRKAPRKGGKQTNTHMANILKDFSHLRK